MMKKQLVTINLKKINVVSYAMFFASLIITLSFKFTVFSTYQFGFGFWDYLIIVVACPMLFICHEFVHALSFLLGGISVKSIKFGIIPKKFMLYCTTSEPISKNKYIFSLIMPLVLTGIIPLIISMVLLNFKYLVLFALMISGAAGDVVMLIELTKYKNAKMILDHPKAPAFYLLYDEDELPENFVEATDEMEQRILKEISSK